MRWLSADGMRFVSVAVVAAIVLGGGRARGDFTFGTPTNLGPTVNTEYYEDNPCISADGLELYFNSSRPNNHGGADLWVAKRPSKSDPWGAPINLGATVNSSGGDAVPCISTDGLSLFFMSDRPGGSGDGDLWVTMRTTTSDPWSEPVNLGPTVNSPGLDTFPSISADGLELFFSSGPGLTADMDLWVTRRATTGDDWTTPVNLGAGVNSSVWDFDPYISPSGLMLCFRSDRPPGRYPSGNVWVTRRKSVSDLWGPPVCVGTTDDRPVDERGEGDAGLAFSSDGSTLYFSPDDRPGGFGRYDLWQAPVIAIVDFNGDGKVDGFEFTKLVDHWGENEPSCDVGPTALGDGVVDVNDLIVLAEYIGKDINDPRLVAHWTLDETEGDIAHDSLGKNLATVVGDAVWQPAGGAVDGALSLDGVNDCLATEAVRDPSEGPMSVFAWVKGGAPGQVLVSQVLGANWLMADVSAGCLMTDLKQSGRSGKALVSETAITDGNWHRVGLVWDGTNRLLYVDDVLVAADTQSNLVGSNGGLSIGCDKNQTPGSFWSGLIDEVRIYSRAVKP